MGNVDFSKGMADSASRNRMLVAAALFAGFGAAHLIDDFLYGVPREFHMSIELCQILGLSFIAALTALISLAASGHRTSAKGLVLIGLLLALADSLKHVPEMIRAWPYRSGFVSTTLALGLILTGLMTAGTAYLALRSAHPAQPQSGLLADAAAGRGN